MSRRDWNRLPKASGGSRLVAVNKAGDLVESGTVVHAQRGDGYVFLYPTRATEEGSSGKVMVRQDDGFRRELFAHILGLEVKRCCPDCGRLGVVRGHPSCGGDA